MEMQGWIQIAAIVIVCWGCVYFNRRSLRKARAKEELQMKKFHEELAELRTRKK